MFVQFFKVTGKKRVLMDLGLVVCGWLVGVLMMVLMTSFAMEDEKKEIAAIGCLLAMMVLLVCKILPFSGALGEFQLAVSMNRARKKYLSCSFIMELLDNTAVVVLLYVLYKIEQMIYKMLFPGAFYEFKIDVIFQVGIMAGIVMLLSVLRMFVVALGMLHVMLPYLLWLLVCFSPAVLNGKLVAGSFIGKALEGVALRFVEMPQGWMFLGMAGLAAVLGAVAVRILCRRDI